jgi:hypothetical protein
MVLEKTLSNIKGSLEFDEMIDWLIDYLWFYVPLKNFSLIQRRHQCRCSGPLSREGSLSCHTYCDTGPPFFQSHPKDRPIQLPLTTRMGMWRIYSNPDPHGGWSKWKSSLISAEYIPLYCLEI